MHNEQEKAVITASRYPHGYASIRSLGRSDVPTIAAVADRGLGVAVSRYCDETVLIPPPSDLSAYKHALLGLAARPDVRTIVPHRPQDPYILAKHAEEFDQYVDLAVPSFELLRTVHDRKLLMKAAETADVPFPETQLLDEVTDWSHDHIIKARYNLLTEEYVDSSRMDDLGVEKSVLHSPAGETPDTAAICEQMNHIPIVQEYVESAGQYVFGALYDHGEPLATFQHRQLRANSYTGGGGVYRETVDISELEEVGRTLLDHLEWHGLACIEYIEDAETGEFKPVEINPRMWQSLACATRAGADFPYWYWLLVTGNADRIEPGYETGVRSHYLYGELQYLLSVMNKRSPFVERPSLQEAVGEILQSYWDAPTFDYFQLDDPLPALRQGRYELTQMIRHRIE